MQYRFMGTISLAGVLLVAGAQAAAAMGDVERGRKLAHAHCSRCHVVSPETRLGGISSTPSFALLVNALKDWQARFETFHARRPHPIFIRIDGIPPAFPDLPPNAHPITIPMEAVADIISYAATLKRR